MPDFEPLNPDYAARVRESFARQSFMTYIGAKITDLKPGFCEITLPFRDEIRQQHGFFHGGVVATIADTAGGYAAFSLMDAASSVLTVEFKVNLMAPARGRSLVARGEVARAGRNLTVCHSNVFGVADGEEKHCATAIVTLMALAGRADEPDVS